MVVVVVVVVVVVSSSSSSSSSSIVVNELHVIWHSAEVIMAVNSLNLRM